MIFYIYDEKTKEYIGTQNAFIDPLETKKQGKEVYLVPPNATDKKPLETKENQAVIFNGTEWEIVADYRNKTYYIGTEKHEMKELGDLPKGATFEPVEPEKTLDELKASKLSELTTITSKFDNQLVNTDMIIKSSLGFSINADLRSQLNIRRLISIGAEPVSFIIANNTTVDLSLAQLNILISECEENMQHLFDLKQSYKKQITDATTKEELDAIDLQFTMKDFSKNND